MTRAEFAVPIKPQSPLSASQVTYFTQPSSNFQSWLSDNTLYIILIINIKCGRALETLIVKEKRFHFRSIEVSFPSNFLQIHR